MAKTDIRLGDEIEDVTAKVSGIAIGRTELLDGSVEWIMQPQYDDEGRRVDVVIVQDAYARRIGDGVYPKPKPVMGFHARGVKDGS